MSAYTCGCEDVVCELPDVLAAIDTTDCSVHGGNYAAVRRDGDGPGIPRLDAPDAARGNLASLSVVPALIGTPAMTTLED